MSVDQPRHDKLIFEVDHFGVLAATHLTRGYVSVSHLNDQIIPNNNALLC